ncbi:MAG: hypothetical protein ACRD43_13980 [Pyrinomonadaceae bacterium]
MTAEELREMGDDYRKALHQVNSTLIIGILELLIMKSIASQDEIRLMIRSKTVNLMDSLDEKYKPEEIQLVQKAIAEQMYHLDEQFDQR